MEQKQYVSLLPKDNRHPIIRDLEQMNAAGEALDLVTPRSTEKELLSQSSEIVLQHLKNLDANFDHVQSVLETIRGIKLELMTPLEIVDEICNDLSEDFSGEEIRVLRNELLEIWGAVVTEE